MGAVWMRFRAELRRRWRAWLGLALLVGAFGGAVVGAAAGATRTDSVVDRSIAKRRPPDIFIVPVFGIQELGPELAGALDLDHLRAFPSVADGTHMFLLPTVENMDVAATDDTRLGTEIFPSELVEGRLPDPDRADEAVANVVAMNRLGLHAGDHYTIHFQTNFGFGAEPRPAATVRFRITGITAGLGDLAAIAEPGLSLTPAFLDRYGDRFDDVRQVELSMLRLRNGAESYAAFRKDVEKVTEGTTVFYNESAGWTEARRSFGLQADSLWILAGVLALVTVLVLGQTIARQTFVESAEHPVLGSLGFTRAQLSSIGILRAATIGIAGALAAILVAAGTSPLAPFGSARLADPSPAFLLQRGPLAIGAAAIVLVVVALALIPSWRAARVVGAGPGSIEEWNRPARIAGAASRAVPGPSAAVGVRMAFERGRGRTAVPVRTTISATAVGVLALTAALVVGSSLDHLTTTPRLYGWNWDVAAVSPAFNDGQEPDPAAGARNRAALRALPGIASVSFGPEGGQLLVNDVIVEPFGLELGAAVAPPLLDGRAPAAPNEIALARKTLAAARAKIGDTVQVGFQGTTVRAPFRVVGITVLPLSGDSTTLGDGVWIPVEDLGRLFGELIPMDRALIRFAPDADRAAIAKTLGERFNAEIKDAEPPGTVVDFGAVSQMPHVLAGIVGLLAAGTIGYGLVTAVRRRRRDLSILKALGLDRRQVRWAVAWQASATALATLALSIPLGVIAGRLIWIAFANASGFLAAPIVDLALIALTVPAAVIVANLISALPARIAARTVPAVVLRTE
ncbi:MAG: FtsX-like permease family protein [Actinomycetota bacterium]